MASASCTILEYLSRPNPKVKYPSSATKLSGTLSRHDNWSPIEGLVPWKTFSYDILSSRYSDLLKETITPFDPTLVISNGCLDEIGNEDTVTALFTVNNLLPVNNALNKFKKGLHIGPGSKFFKEQSDGSPDWGTGHADKINEGLPTLQNICPGDLKPSLKWNSDGLLKAEWGEYDENKTLLKRALPLEQAQYYATSLGARYTWIMTDQELVVIRVTTSTDGPRSPRPSRNISHDRGLSDTSMISNALSEMSIDGSLYSGHSDSSSGNNPCALEIAQIPWSAGSKSTTGAGKKMTINLALFFLTLLASEDYKISTSYPPLDAPRPNASK